MTRGVRWVVTQDDRVVGTQPKNGRVHHGCPGRANVRAPTVEFILTARQGGFHLRLAHQLHHGAGYGAKEKGRRVLHE
jgi:hypothetical protein